MDDGYLSDFRSFRDEFQLARDEVLCTTCETLSVPAKAVIFDNETAQAARLAKINLLGDLCSNLIRPHKVSDLSRARKPPNLKSKVVLRQTFNRTEPGVRRVIETHGVTDGLLPGRTGLGPRKGHRKSRRGCFQLQAKKSQSNPTPSNIADDPDHPSVKKHNLHVPTV